MSSGLDVEEALRSPEPNGKQLKVIGLALKPKKAATIVTQGLHAAAAVHGVRLVVLDVRRSLEGQGPFDVILHKLPLEDPW